jgi:two-component system, cell cycle response regulator
MLRQMISIDHVLARLRLGDTREATEQLPTVVGTLLPLLELLESQLGCGIPLGELARYKSENEGEGNG